MKTGLLWYDDNPGRTLADKITAAANRYRQKTGKAANVCFVHPSALSDNSDGAPVKKVGEVEVRTRRTVLIHHFWVGRRVEVAPVRRASGLVQAVLL